jgi:predicted kinase
MADDNSMQRYAFIMRGIPGSGKSTVAKMIARGCFPGQANIDGSQWLTDAVIHSTDDLCMVDGEYRFDVALAGERHAQNLQNFKDSLAAHKPCVIVDNTNVKVEQYHPYMKAAEAEGYRVVIVELPHPAPVVAAQRNTHGVPIEVINQMVLDWEPSQHCVTVAKVEHAARIVRSLQRRERKLIYLAWGVGAAFGAVAASLAWLIF